MKLETQVVSLDLAKRLKELGVKQESYFWWQVDSFIQVTEQPHILAEEWLEDDRHRYRRYSAFTVAELGEILPLGSYTHRYADEKDAGWTGRVPGEPNAFGAYDTEVNGRARMLIYLIEHDLIPESLTEKGKE